MKVRQVRDWLSATLQVWSGNTGFPPHRRFRRVWHGILMMQETRLNYTSIMARGNDGMDQAAEGSYWFAYWGVGAKVNVQENDPEFIARFPIGSEYILDKGPFGFFAEVVPGVRFVPDTRFKLSASAGVRFYFIKGGK